MENIEGYIVKIIGIIIIGTLYKLLDTPKKSSTQFKVAFEILKTKIIRNNILSPFNPPISKSQYLELKSSIDFKIPDEFIWLLKEVNGQRSISTPLFNSYYFLSSVQISETWTNLYNLLNKGAFREKVFSSDASIINSWWNSYWIPFATNKHGDYLCIDMGPGIQGNEGQVIEVVHESGERTLHSKSFIEWFECLGNEMEVKK
ncbi:MAG: SMI1/KNR4 family protein [Saccharospirillaceae bacterium]|nr:SMI1/KNR4 family protein [Pseudomonadales bacterium]NRB79890.1 SMI1/KNR4 family protein [Saccharospirillaceae bacterium]